MALNDPIWQQNGTYSASEFRDVLETLPGTGVIADGDLKVTQRGAGANMSVDVAAGLAVIPNSTPSRGKYLCRSTAVENVLITASPGSGNSRIDLIVARVNDTEYGDATDDWEIVAIAGTPSGSPSAPALPAGSILLATVSVGTGVSSIINNFIADGRSYARTVTYTDRLPAVAENGQVVVSAAGAISTRSGGTWKTAPRSNQYGITQAAMAGATLSVTATGYCTANGPTPTGPVNVFAAFNGAVVASTGSNAVTQLRVQISLDGGSTWVTGDDVLINAPSSLSPSSISAAHALQGTPSGSVKARVLANRTGSPQPDLGGHIVLMVTPG